ncbi:MAG TPA: pilus assembly protein PilN [Gammaproteobacteria bacterium]|nr:pilus assembly protein PilN [Gammaproteobacteria bacterium]
MTRINLLPWREQQRKEKEREFYSIAGGAAVLMVLVVVYVHFHISGLIDEQHVRNEFLAKEIKAVEGKIKEIKELETAKDQLLARMQIIEQLQRQRPLVVHLFDELVKTIPDGVYLTSIRQEGATITLVGVAQSNARVSAFMRNIDASPWLANPRLDVIEALEQADNARASKFVLNVTQVSGAGDDAAEDAE